VLSRGFVHGDKIMDKEMMEYHLIKAYMMFQRVTIDQITQKHKTSRQMVWKVIKGNQRNGYLTALIRRSIADACKLDYAQMWGEENPLWNGDLEWEPGQIKNKRKLYKTANRKRKRGTKRSGTDHSLGQSTPSGEDTKVS
jgi:hypothetical protein